ncbi:MAG: DHH family phosphoesterase [Candidatus Diapherotrites archaeon]
MDIKLEEKLQEFASEIRARDDFAVIHHYDADGISAGAIVAKALQRDEKKLKCKAVKQLYSETFEEIKGLGENYIFVDFGSGQLEELKKEFGDNFFVLDHHQPVDVEHKFHINPFHFGIDGGNEISGAGMAYLFAKTYDSENKFLAPLAIVGAVGDMQDFSGKLRGMNAEILQEAVANGFMESGNDLRLYGRISRPLTQFLMFSSNPIIPELTADEEKCIKFLNRLGIELRQNEQWRSYIDLSAEEKKKLTSALIVHMHSHNVVEWKIKELIGEIYTLVKEDRKSPLSDAKEFATLMNSCGRHGMAEIGLAVAMGDRKEEYGKALSLLVEHRKQLREGIEMMKERGLEEMEAFYFFDAGEEIKDSIVGIVAGMLYGSGTIESSKPVIAFARHEDGSVKVSGRGTKELVYKGLNLGMAFKEVCAELGEGAQGGGHKIAAGCKFPAESKDKFLELLNTGIKRQITS